MVMHRSAKICAASAMGIQHSQTAANLFYDGPQTRPMRLESVEEDDQLAKKIRLQA
jgi:hypothetical protein